MNKYFENKPDISVEELDTDAARFKIRSLTNQFLDQCDSVQKNGRQSDKKALRDIDTLLVCYLFSYSPSVGAIIKFDICVVISYYLRTLKMSSRRKIMGHLIVSLLKIILGIKNYDS